MDRVDRFGLLRPGPRAHPQRGGCSAARHRDRLADLGIAGNQYRILVGTPLLNTNKKSKEPERKTEMVERTARRFKERPAEVDRNREGILYGNSSIAFARITDMFQGDELANAQLVDVAKLQLFFFTVIVAIAYGTQLFQLIAYGDLDLPGIRLPVLQDGLLALMGVSHAGYLGAKG